ncbi:hypothetical protein PGTUg99_015111 [Puccinia graminis f. sp. tritici]|uniref:Uncharacterized protein n=1 Tax=Puccinia graminis f. sp. tritici TaxID=56615 RepID=A0A5B0LS61_PUCGR|nr:hypothetical protein PGTUg99_015111 [Puccinia graminis f. sp. tritici]
MERASGIGGCIIIGPPKFASQISSVGSLGLVVHFLPVPALLQPGYCGKEHADVSLSQRQNAWKALATQERIFTYRRCSILFFLTNRVYKQDPFAMNGSPLRTSEPAASFPTSPIGFFPQVFSFPNETLMQVIFIANTYFQVKYCVVLVTRRPTGGAFPAFSP